MPITCKVGEIVGHTDSVAIYYVNSGSLLSPTGLGLWSTLQAPVHSLRCPLEPNPSLREEGLVGVHRGALWSLKEGF